LEQGGELIGLDAPVEQIDAFYAAWVDDLIDRAVERMLDEYHRAGKGDYFRVLHGRLCEEMAMGDIASSLGLKVTSVENYFKAARKRLAEVLRELLKEQIRRYADQESAGDAQDSEEFDAEWRCLGDYLKAHGGLEAAVGRAYAGADSTDRRERKTGQINQTLSRINSAETT
jgi:hypothetical protein